VALSCMLVTIFSKLSSFCQLYCYRLGVSVVSPVLLINSSLLSNISIDTVVRKSLCNRKNFLRSVKMVSLWGTKKGDEEDHGPRSIHSQNGESTEHGSARNTPRYSQEADERTQLLPPPSREGYLSPDDPAVSSSCSLHCPFVEMTNPSIAMYFLHVLIHPHRSPHTTYGASGSFDTSQFCSQLLPSYGGCYYWCRSSFLHQECTQEVLASSISHIRL
jgi:hypothetical protein